MGIPAPSRAEVHKQDMFQSALPKSVNARGLKSLSGNGMHVCVVGSLLFCILRNISSPSPATSLSGVQCLDDSD